MKTSLGESSTGPKVLDRVLFAVDRAELTAYQFRPLAFLLKHDPTFSSEVESVVAFEELKRYLWLRSKYGRLIMWSAKVDAVWHQFILFTEEYHSFCDRFFGSYQHHLPTTRYTLPTFVRNDFWRVYELEFGVVPEIWGVKR